MPSLRQRETPPEREQTGLRKMDGKLFLISAALIWRASGAASRDFRFKALHGCKENFALFSNVNVTLVSRSKLDCAKSCCLHPQCVGFNLCQSESSTSSVPLMCHLVSQWSQNSCGALIPAPGCIYRQLDIPCVYGSVDTAAKTCVCSAGAYGQGCENVIIDCHDGMQRGLYNDYRLSLIQPMGVPTAFTTNCNFGYGLTALAIRDHTCGSTDAFVTGTWQTLQKRTINGSCIFIGLDNIYKLLNQGINYQMSAYVVYDSWANAAKVHYSSVNMDNSTGRYTLTLGSWSTNSVAGDGFSGSQNWKFCSPDHDCSGCAAGAGHAGWYDDSGAGCLEAKGLGHPLQWPINGIMQNVIHVNIEVERK